MDVGSFRSLVPGYCRQSELLRGVDDKEVCVSQSATHVFVKLETNNAGK